MTVCDRQLNLCFQQYRNHLDLITPLTSYFNKSLYNKLLAAEICAFSTSITDFKDDDIFSLYIHILRHTSKDEFICATVRMDHMGILFPITDWQNSSWKHTTHFVVIFRCRRDWFEKNRFCLFNISVYGETGSLAIHPWSQTRSHTRTCTLQVLQLGRVTLPSLLLNAQLSCKLPSKKYFQYLFFFFWV